MALSDLKERPCRFIERIACRIFDRNFAIYLALIFLSSSADACAVRGRANGTARINYKDHLAYVWVPPGHFVMGCTPADGECTTLETPAHEVTIGKGFWIGKSEVTQDAYERITGQNPSLLKGRTQPVEHITWEEAVSYCGMIGGRLPTETEWNMRHGQDAKACVREDRPVRLVCR